MIPQNIEAQNREIKLYVTDLAGTLNNKNQFVNQVQTNFDTHALEYYISQGLSRNDAKAKVEHGLQLRSKSQNNEEYLKMQDEVGAYAFQSGKMKMEVYDDAPSTLVKIKDSGTKTAVYSVGLKKSLQPAFRTVKLDGGKTLDDYVSKYFSSFDIGPKNKVEGYRKICESMGISIDEAVYIDDEAPNARAAVNAGFKKVYRIIRGKSDKSKLDKDGKHPDGYFVINYFSQVLGKKAQKTAGKKSEHHENTGEESHQLSEEARNTEETNAGNAEACAETTEAS